MRKLLLSVLCLAVAMVLHGQTITKQVTLKSTDLGNQKLVAILGNDTAYAMQIKTGNRFQKYLTVGLGDKKDAVRLLTFLYDVELSKGDVIDLENPTHNLISKNQLGGLLVISEGRQLSGQLRKPNIKGFIEAIQEFAPE